MSKKSPVDPKSEAKAKKTNNLNTKGKNAAGQTNGQFEQDTKRRTRQFTGAGEAPLMKK